ncbi:MAG TPA: hypothetical protein VKA26_14455, partial [Ignavibacteriaceae bacterium]|nr:hypothetical protein [Ignavibacteriaceae bacterium]
FYFKIFVPSQVIVIKRANRLLVTISQLIIILILTECRNGTDSQRTCKTPNVKTVYPALRGKHKYQSLKNSTPLQRLVLRRGIYAF